MYTEVLCNLTGNVFLTTSRDHSFLLSHGDTALHTSIESSKPNHMYDKSLTSSTTTHM